jgi:hypothetical protein
MKSRPVFNVFVTFTVWAASFSLYWHTLILRAILPVLPDNSKTEFPPKIKTSPVNTSLSIPINSNFSMRANLVENSINNQPPGYPWYPAGLIQEHHNFSLLWERINQPELYLEVKVRQKPILPLYLVYEGKLYIWRKHLDVRNEKKSRSKEVEKMIANSLNLMVHAGSDPNELGTIDPRLQEIITIPLPFFIDVGDFRKCWGTNYPFFAYATFTSIFRTGNNTLTVDGELQSCIPLGLPYYQTPPLRPAIKINTSDVETWDSVFERQHKEYPWNNKVNEAVWRGSTTGAGYVYPNWRDLPRAKLVLASKVNTNSSKINAGFYKVVQRNATEEQEIKDLGLLKESIPLKDFQKYKAVIDMDGNSWSSRFSFLLCMNSVVLKVQPDWSDYFFEHELSPYVHYLPIHKNLSNLEETISAVMNSDNAALMKSIVHNANSWCKRKFTGSQRYLDMAWIMISYLELLKSEDFYSKTFTKWKNNFNSSAVEKNWKAVTT